MAEDGDGGELSGIGQHSHERCCHQLVGKTFVPEDGDTGQAQNGKAFGLPVTSRAAGQWGSGRDQGLVAFTFSI